MCFDCRSQRNSNLQSPARGRRFWPQTMVNPEKCVLTSRQGGSWLLTGSFPSPSAHRQERNSLLAYKMGNKTRAREAHKQQHHLRWWASWIPRSFSPTESRGFAWWRHFIVLATVVTTTIMPIRCAPFPSCSCAAASGGRAPTAAGWAHPLRHPWHVPPASRTRQPGPAVSAVCNRGAPLEAGPALLLKYPIAPWGRC